MNRQMMTGAVLLGLLGSVDAMGQEQTDSLRLSKELPEVSIVATKPLIKQEPDRTIYSVAEDPEARTLTLLEMLRKVPMVSVDSEDNVKVNGQSDFKIYVNGRPSNLYSNNPKVVLRSVPAGTIKRVEVIIDPGSRFDAEGVSGILNIVTKGAALEGYNASLDATLSNLYNFVGGFATIKYGRLSLSGNYTFSRSAMRQQSTYVRQQSRPTEERLATFSDIHTRTPAHFGALEASFEIDSLNLLAFSGNLDMGRNRSRRESRYQMDRLPAQERIYAYEEDRTDKEEWGSASVKADYQRRFRGNPAEMLTLSYQYDYIPNDNFAWLHLRDKAGVLASPQREAEAIRQESSAHSRIHTAQVDYLNPFSRRHSVEGGLKLTRRVSTSHSVSDWLREGESDWSPLDVQPAVHYRHMQQILAAYAAYRLSWGRWSFNPGLRMEKTWQQVDYQEGNGKDFDYQAMDWIPSWNSAFRINDRNQLRLTYTQRIRRPDISYLNPTVFISGTSLSYGNPGLVSEKHHRLALSYNYNGRKLSLQARLLYSVGRGTIEEYMFQDAEGIIHSTYDNLVDMRGGSGSFFVSYAPVPVVNLSLNAILGGLNFRARKGNSIYDESVSTSGLLGNLYLNAVWRLRHGWRVMGMGGYIHPEPTFSGKVSGQCFYGLTLSKSFFKERLVCSLRAQDFLADSRRQTRKRSFPGFTIRQEERFFNRSFSLTVSYRFGDLREKVKQAERTIRPEDWLKR